MSAAEMTPEAAAMLRAPFPPAAIGKLPRITCKACSDARGKCCADHKKSECRVCGNWMTPKHIHLDYVGHADVTARLLEVDPGWWWEPTALAPDGTPMIVTEGRDAVMWIRLTVCGVSRLGVGIVEASSFELEKQLISDSLRNAAMRFGVAVDLWAKHEALESTIESADESPAPIAPTPAAAPAEAEPLAEGMVATREAKQQLVAALEAAGATDPKASAAAAWKASKIKAGPIPLEVLERMMGDALDVLFAELAEADAEAPARDG